jgi:hypothetical protein
MNEAQAHDLIRFKEHVVPWVSRWSGEADTAALGIAKHAKTGHLTLFYKDTGDPDDQRDRDEQGVLWSRDGQDRSGFPEFGQVNALRQRTSMLERLCQVCGKKIEDQPIHWLMGPNHLYQVEGRYVTMSPPTCSACVSVSKSLCPHLSAQGSRLLLVARYEVWGVYGEATWLENGAMRRNSHAAVSYANPEHPLCGVLAKQLLVSFTEFTDASD